MGLSFITPLLFGGLALLVGPYLIHQIRRPEREPVKFSSLLFIPDVQKEVIERKRIQHILLMLMRMTALTLLAIAFTRPYWKAQALADGQQGPVRHLVMMDTSYSMGVGNTFPKAKAEALRVIGDVPADEQVGFMTFAENTAIHASIAGETTARGEIDRFVNAASVSAQATDYKRALETAYRHAVQEEGKLTGRLVLHMISDFRKKRHARSAAGLEVAAAGGTRSHFRARRHHE